MCYVTYGGMPADSLRTPGVGEVAVKKIIRPEFEANNVSWCCLV